MRNGKGLFKGFDGLVYEGEWKNNLYDGLGSLINSDNSIYTGNFVEGKKNGKGKYIVGKVIYEGNFLNDFKHGEGKESYPDESNYVGSFKNGMKNGLGINELK